MRRTWFLQIVIVATAAAMAAPALAADYYLCSQAWTARDSSLGTCWTCTRGTLRSEAQALWCGFTHPGSAACEDLSVTRDYCPTVRPWDAGPSAYYPAWSCFRQGADGGVFCGVPNFGSCSSEPDWSGLCPRNPDSRMTCLTAGGVRACLLVCDPLDLASASCNTAGDGGGSDGAASDLGTGAPPALDAGLADTGVQGSISFQGAGGLGCATGRPGRGGGATLVLAALATMSVRRRARP